MQEQVMGIEPTYPAWKAGVLPMNYTCLVKLCVTDSNERVGVTGFEPAASWSQTRRSSQTEPHPVLFAQTLLYVNEQGLSTFLLSF